jgi:hypothetical protein
MDDLERARHDGIRLLCSAQARDVISFEAFEDRLERLKLAPNRATVEAIVADLIETNPYPGPLEVTSTVPPAGTGDHTAVAFSPAPFEPAESLRIGTVLGSTKRGGSWTVPLHLDVMVLLGELTIDLRDAVFGSDVLDIDVNVKLGSLSLIVPAGAQVENEVHETMSSSTYSARSARGASPIGLLIRLQGRVFMGSIDVKEKPPTALSGGQAWWQRLLPSGER